VASGAAARRLEIFAAARAKPGEFLRFDPGRVRFSLGTSLSDVRIPVQLSADAAAIVHSAAAEVALLLATHHRAFVLAGELDRLYLREDYASLPRAEDALSPPGGGPDLRAAAQLGAAAHPALAGGLTCAWMGPGGRGRSLTGLFIQVLQRAFAEMSASPEQEETPLIAILALTGALQDAAVQVREALPGPPVGRYLRAAAHTGLWVAARTGLARAFRDAGRPGDDRLLLRAEAVLSPAALMGGRSAVLAGGSTLYGCDLAAGVPRADEITGRLAAGGDADAAAGDLAAALAADEDLSRRAELAVAVGRLREGLAAGVAGAEAAGLGASLRELRELLAAPGALAAAAADDANRRALARHLGGWREALPAGEAASHLERAERSIKAWRPREPAAALGLRREQARAEYATAAAALLCDGALERMAAAARSALVARTGAEAEGGADAEWEGGRLYRISARAEPILRRAQERPLGHLFADVKDFTRRTALLGQAAMAEFLRLEFYLPIVTAAKAHFSGMQHLHDRGGVSVNNLLGDAISLSGDIEAMVQLAAEIRRLLSAYEARLARQVSSEVVARQIAAIEDGFRSRLELARKAGDAAELARLGDERERALARARGEGLEAGVFISHGPAPLVVVIDDEVFGKNRVAIAEKINESARGTARAASARAGADALLAAERVARGAPALQHAWSVFIGQPLAISLPPAAQAAAVRAARAGDLAAALRGVAVPVREAIAAAAGGAGEVSGDIYNSGAAVSEQALEAYLEAVARVRTIRRVQLLAEEAPPEISAQWWLGEGPQRLVACFHLDGRLGELFRYAGRAAFKGLAEVPVWELCADSGAPAALARALRRRWLESG
jgi:hypothetical protein